MGIERIKKNLKTDMADVVEYCKNEILILLFYFIPRDIT